jgi:hypothetical protein
MTSRHQPSPRRRIVHSRRELPGCAIAYADVSARMRSAAEHERMKMHTRATEMQVDGPSPSCARCADDTQRATARPSSTYCAQGTASCRLSEPSCFGALRAVRDACSRIAELADAICRRWRSLPRRHSMSPLVLVRP